MAKVTIHSGDVPTGRGDFMFGTLVLPPPSVFGSREAVRPSAILGLYIASEDVVKGWGGSLGMSAMGAMAFGPVDALAGLLSGGWDCEVTFAVLLRDGRCFLATSSGKTYDALRAGLS